MTLRVCAEPGCPTLGPSTRCPDCTRTKDRERGTSTERGYGAAHQREREAWRPMVEAGHCRCRRCLKPILAAEPWDLGHPDADCDAPKSPEHERCNRAVSGR